MASSVKQLHAKMMVVDCSSVYRVRGKVKRPAHIHDLRSITTFEGQTVALHCLSPVGPDETMKTLLQIEESIGNLRLHRTLSLNLLMFEEEVRMAPALSLPHPDLHRRAELLVPAAEVWGEKRHPVLKKELQALAQGLCAADWGEFVAQKSQLLKLLSA